MSSKISALTAATGALAGTEVVPLVQSSTTKKCTVWQLRGTTTDIWVTNLTTSIPFTQNQWNTVAFNSVATDALGEYASSTGTFTPGVTGTYLLSVFISANVSGRIIVSVWTGTASETWRLCDHTGYGGGADRQLKLAGGVGYRIRVFTDQAANGTAVGQHLTYMLIRRLD